MPIIRQQNWLGQQRVDVPHLRSVEIAAAADMDVLAGQMMAGSKPFIVYGFNMVAASAGVAATSLQIQTAGGVIMHPLASESGTIFSVPITRPLETLNASNTRVIGSFQASSINYIGIDLRRTADSTTADLVQFLDPATLLEKPKQVPLGRTLDYVIVISTTDFNSNPGIAPLAKVTTDSNNNVTTVVYNSVTYPAIEDARNMMFRLGKGGTVTNPVYAYLWPGSRSEIGNNSDFSAGDKAIGNMKDWMDAMMTRLWEVGGGEHWYTSTADRNVQFIRNGTTIFSSSGDYFEWTGTNLHWQGLRINFPNSTGSFNDIKDQLVDSTGLTNLADGDCIYVDIDRTQNRTGASALVAVKSSLLLMGSPTVPGSRFIIAWRSGTNIFTRGTSYAIGQAFQVATTVQLGVVKLHQASLTPASPVVLSDGDLNTTNGVVALNASRAASWTALLASNSTAITATGDGTGAGGSFIGGSNGVGLFAQGNGTRDGINSTGGAGGGNGVVGTGSGAGNGVSGTGGTSSGTGGSFAGGSPNGLGLNAQGQGTGAGINTQGGGTAGAPGIWARGGNGGGNGVQAIAQGAYAALDAAPSTTAGSTAITAHGALNNPSAIMRPVRSDGKIGALVDYLGFRNGPVMEKTVSWWGLPAITNAVSTQTSSEGLVFSSNSAHGIVNANGGAAAWTSSSTQIEITTAGVGGDAVSISSPLFVNIANTTGMIAVAEWSMTWGGGGTADGDYWVGFMPFGGAFTTIPTTNQIGVRYSVTAGDTTLQLSTGDAVTNTVTPNTGAVTPVFGTIRRYRLEYHGSGSPYGLCARLFIDGVLTSKTTNIPTTTGSSGYMYFGALVRSRGTGNTNILELGPLRLNVLMFGGLAGSTTSDA